jgi:hypothetical protein
MPQFEDVNLLSVNRIFRSYSEGFATDQKTTLIAFFSESVPKLAYYSVFTVVDRHSFGTKRGLKEFSHLRNPDVVPSPPFLSIVLMKVESFRRDR